VFNSKDLNELDVSLTMLCHAPSVPTQDNKIIYSYLKVVSLILRYLFLQIVNVATNGTATLH